MPKRLLGVAGAMAVALSLLAEGASAQVDITAPAHLNFEQFKKVVDSDDLGFFTSLKWAGMKFVNSPVADRVVPVYEYNTDSIRSSVCSREAYNSDHALLVNWAVPVSEAIEAVRLAGVDLTLKPEEFNKNLEEALADDDWVTVDVLSRTLDSYNVEYQASEVRIPEPKAVWYEVPFVNTCQLQETIDNLDTFKFSWRPVLDAKLKEITRFPAIESGSYDGSLAVAPAHVFVTYPIEGAVETVQYWAECGDVGRRGGTRRGADYIFVYVSVN